MMQTKIEDILQDLEDGLVNNDPVCFWNGVKALDEAGFEALAQFIEDNIEENDQ